MLKAMRNAFAEAQAAAPSLLFVDEVDAVGDRMDADKRNANYQRQVINAFLECLDGAEARTGVIVVGATNHPDLIDPAVRRPGRLDRDLRIPLPDTASRVGILRHHLGNDLLGVDLEPVAVRLEGASGAAIERAVRDGSPPCPPRASRHAHVGS
ncbi:ATP-binding protein [Aurantimonas sp. DM33-3]|nr:ATP-binding protein [Aurantimonas sp. DM33-3]